MKKFSKQINERLKLSKDSKVLNLSFTKININQLKTNDTFYTVYIYVDKSKYGELASTKLEICYCDSGLITGNNHTNIYRLKWRSEEPHFPTYFHLDGITTKEMIDRYDNNEKSFLILCGTNNILYVLFDNKNEANAFINNYDLFKDFIIDEFKKYVLSNIK